MLLNYGWQKHKKDVLNKENNVCMNWIFFQDKARINEKAEFTR